MHGTCTRDVSRLIGLGTVALVAGSAMAGGFIEEPLPLPTIGPLGAGQSQTVNVDVAQNNNSVVGFRFVGTVTGVSGSDMWASDLRLQITAPGGATHEVGGYDNLVNPWDFQGGTSTNDGTYTHEDANAFPGIAKGGQWSFTFTNDWGGSPGTHTWSNVVITLLKVEGSPEGACCFADDGSCQILSPVDCDNAGGIYFGNFTTCEEVTCPTPVICPAGNNCPQDLNGDSVVDIFDLLALLGAWGPCPGCPADLTGDNVVDIFDLLNLLGAWGPCPAGGSNVFFEAEACGEDTNGGCNSTPPAYEAIECGQTVCGTAWADGGTRDTDWYSITVTEDTEITWSVHAEFPAQAFILNDQCGDNLIVLASDVSAAGVPFDVTACVTPGTYRLFVSDQAFEGNPCGSDSNDYVASVSCSPCVATGACCLGDGTCQDLSPQDCAAAGGAFNVLPCEQTVCIPDPGNCPQGKFNEGEPCVTGSEDTVNGGCNVTPPVFGQICCGDTVSGTVWADGGTRDLDWFILTITEQSLVQVELTHNFGQAGLDGVAFLATAVCPPTIITSAASPSPVQIGATLQPGNYIVIVAPAVFEGMPCNSGTANEYSASVLCVPTTVCDDNCGGFYFDPDTNFFCSCEKGCADFSDCCPGVCQSCPDFSTCVENDACADAIDITANINGAPVAGTTINATPASGAGGDPELPGGSPSCHWNGTPTAVHNTVWYSFQAPASGEVFISLCDSPSTSFAESTIVVFSGACGALTEIACGEDECGSQGDTWFSSTCAAGLTPGQTYYVMVANSGGWEGSIPGDFEFVVTDSCVSCATVDCQDNVGEPCAAGPDTINGGCNSTPPVFQPIACGETKCGELRADGGTRDLDWFQLTLASPATVTWTAEADFNATNPPTVVVFIANGVCPTTVIASSSGLCSAETSATLAAGTYYIIVAPGAFEGLPCADGPHKYSATLTCQ